MAPGSCYFDNWQCPARGVSLVEKQVLVLNPSLIRLPSGKIQLTILFLFHSVAQLKHALEACTFNRCMGKKCTKQDELSFIVYNCLYRKIGINFPQVYKKNCTVSERDNFNKPRKIYTLTNKYLNPQIFTYTCFYKKLQIFARKFPI